MSVVSRAKSLPAGVNLIRNLLHFVIILKGMSKGREDGAMQKRVQINKYCGSKEYAPETKHFKLR